MCARFLIEKRERKGITFKKQLKITVIIIKQIFLSISSRHLYISFKVNTHIFRLRISFYIFFSCIIKSNKYNSLHTLGKSCIIIYKYWFTYCYKTDRFFMVRSYYSLLTQLRRTYEIWEIFEKFVDLMLISRKSSMNMFAWIVGFDKSNLF